MGGVVVILNPRAGRGEGQRRKDRLTRALHEAGVDFELVETTAPGHGIQLAAEARRSGAEIIVAAGGDGTVNEVINGLAWAVDGIGEGETPPDPLAIDPAPVVGTLALLPIGTANDLSDMLDLPRKAELLAQRIVQRRTRRIDLGCCLLTSPDQQLLRYFGNNMGLGFEAQVTLESYKISGVRGALRYLIAVLTAMRRFHSPEIQLSWRNGDDSWQRREHPALLVSIGNTERTGGMFYMTPGALVDDGLLALATARKVSVLGILRLLPKVLRGTHANDPVVEMAACREVFFECTEGAPVHLDGEVVMEDVIKAHIVVQSRRLEIIV